jgi:hypothetical protein
MINTDLQLLAFGLLRDLSIYLRAGHAFLDGQTVYAMHTEAEIAHNSSLYPFVYPPVSIPLFAGLAALPLTVARGLWLAMCLGVSVVGLRAIGVRWRWLPIVLAWPPFVQGIYIGNSIVPAFAFFAVAPMIGALLVVPPIFKSQLGVTGLWLLIERRWRDLALAVGLGLALILVTLPLVGLASWGDWARQLSDFTKLLQEHPAIEGASLAYFLPAVLAGLIGVAAVLVSLTRRRSDGLAALGVASVAASPTLYLDGLTMALPAILRLRAPLLWLAFALGSTLAFQQGFWVAVGLGFAALWFPVLTHAQAPDPAYHPLGSLTRAWPVLAPQGGSVAEAGAPAGAPGRQPEAVAGAPGSRD